MSGVLGTPYFVEMYTGAAYDYAKRQPVDPTAYYGLSASSKSLMVGILSAGVLLGCLMAADLADKRGRRLPVLMGCIVLCFGTTLQIVAEGQEWQFALGRLITGLGVGAFSPSLVTYISEIAPTHRRGLCIASYSLNINLGIFLADAVVMGTEGIQSSAAYRIPISLQYAWAIMLGVGM